MPNESSSDLHWMSFKKNPRNGQTRVFDKVTKDASRKSLNVQLPTGYGKSFVSAGVYSILKKQGRVNRLLIIVPTVAQKNQFVADGPCDLMDANIDGPLDVTDIGFYEDMATSYHRGNKRQIFIITAQALSNGTGVLIKDMMRTGKWMITVDEYHHYGLDKTWGNSVVNLPYDFMLAMSATPFRKDDDSVFGAPDVTVSYRDAFEEGTVKPLKGHSYVYKIDLVTKDLEIVSITTSELVKEAGTDKAAGIEKYVIERGMRQSPKYISPLVFNPISRMVNDRIETGYKLQAIVGAMYVDHAINVCSQIKTLFPNLVVDWVGTGKNGRSVEDNKKIIEAFCPKKDSNGKRNPTIDVLVHVGMAGEGLDSVYVSEVIHLNKASLNNSNNQENGRAARYLPGVTGNINYESCSDYEPYKGDSIMDAMDMNPPAGEEEPTGPREPNWDIPVLPATPAIQFWNIELERIDSGCEEVRSAAKMLASVIAPNKYGIDSLIDDINNPDSDLYTHAVTYYKTLAEKNIKQHNDQTEVEQWKDAVKNGVSVLAGRIMRMATKGGLRPEKGNVGDIMRRINTRKKYELGEIKNDKGCCETHYKWIKRLEETIINTNSIPSWVS